MHTDQRAADVQTGVRHDRLDQHGIAEIRPCGHGKRAARVYLRHGVYDLKAVRLRDIALDDQRAVEMLAALHRERDAARLQNGIDARKRSLCGLEARALADARADQLT